MNELKIREYSSKDEEAVIDLWVKCQLVVPWNNPKQDIERKLQVNPELFLVGTLNDLLIASVMGGYEGHRGWVNYLAVDPRYQNAGYGKEMMVEIEEKVKTLGAPKIQLQVRNTNDKVINFYKSIGYVEDEVVNLGKRLVEDEPFENQE